MKTTAPKTRVCVHTVYFLSQVLHGLLSFVGKVPGLLEKKMGHFLEMN